MVPYFPHLSTNAELRETVRALCSKFPAEYWERQDREGEFAEDFYQAFAAADLLGILVPEEYGGGGGRAADLCAVLEEVAMSGGAMNACSTVHIPQLTVPTLMAFGNEQQRAEVLPKMATGEMYVSFGVTEPDAGTETSKIRTTAKEVDGGFIVNGSKVWNSGALRADKIFLLARTDSADGAKRSAGMSLFITDIKADSITINPIRKIGRNAVASAEVFFTDHFVPAEDLVGERGRGFYHLLHSLNTERLYLASEALGMGRWALQEATRYAKERVIFDRPIGKNQAVAHPLAKYYLELLAASEVLQRALTEYDEKGAGAIGTLANGAKYLASEAAFACADHAMQTFGGFSFSREYHIGRYWTESRLIRIAPVNNQMVLNYIAENELELPRSY